MLEMLEIFLIASSPEISQMILRPVINPPCYSKQLTVYSPNTGVVYYNTGGGKVLVSYKMDTRWDMLGEVQEFKVQKINLKLVMGLLILYM